MSSKIDKQKHIYSLLNDKFSNLVQKSENKDQSGSEEDSIMERDENRLVDKVYHFYKSIIQSINSGLITIDLSGDITFVNKIAGKMLGYEIEELLNRPIKEIFAEDENSRKLFEIMFLPGKRVDEQDIKCIKKDGNSIIIGLTTSPIHDENNKFEGVVLLIRDLTEVIHLRMQIERMERLALLGELSAGIAHEIRNPLAGIKASAQILEDSFGVDDFRYQLIERIVKEVDKANLLLKEFFKFAKPTKPKLKFQDIEMIIDGVYLLLAPKIQKRNIQFSAEFNNEVPQVFVDETQLEQVFLNLFLNSIDAMPGGGQLTVKTSKENLKILDSEKEKYKVDSNELTFVQVQISDTGVGISAENLKKIFNPFFTTKTEGVGLGLSICSRLIEENGGKIDLSSKENEGTTFLLALPAFIHQ
jgi:PAS domain S-box-containing protein